MSKIVASNGRMENYTALNFVADLIDSLVWPILIFAIVWVFKDPLTQLINAIKRLSFRGFEVEMEDDEGDDLDILKEALRGKARSFEWIRGNTPLDLSDEDFVNLIKKDPNFKSVKMRVKASDGSVFRREGIKLLG